MMLYLRPATMEDAGNLLSWRNDPETCVNSRHQGTVPPRRHELWMQINVKFGYPSRIVLIAETGDGAPVGVVDFQARDPKMLSFEVAITIAPNLRGKGYGSAALALACQRMQDKTLLAEIRSDNRASRKIFRKTGFVLMTEADGFAQFQRNRVHARAD